MDSSATQLTNFRSNPPFTADRIESLVPVSNPFVQSSVSSLQDAGQEAEPSCFCSVLQAIWAPISCFFETVFNFLGFLCCLVGREIGPDPFTLTDVKTEDSEEIQWFIQSLQFSPGFSEILTQILQVCNALDHTAQDQKVLQVAVIGLQVQNTELSTMLSYASSIDQATRKANRQALTQSYIELMSRVDSLIMSGSPISLSMSMKTSIVRVSGIRVESFSRETSRLIYESEDSLSSLSVVGNSRRSNTSVYFTAAAARDAFVRNLSDYLGRQLRYEDVFSPVGQFHLLPNAPQQPLLE